AEGWAGGCRTGDQPEERGPRVPRARDPRNTDDAPGRRHFHHRGPGGPERCGAPAAPLATGQRVRSARRRRRLHASGSDGSSSGIAIGTGKQKEVVVTAFSAIAKSRGREIFEIQPVSSVGAALLFTSVIVGLTITFLVNHPAPAVAGCIVGLYLLFAIKVADQWEKAAVLRLGRYRGLRGPGAFHIIPIIDSISRVVDQR